MLFSLCAVRIVQVPAAIALILCIVGGVSANSPAEIGDQDTLKAGIVLYLVVFILLVLLITGAAVGRRKTARGERRLLWAVAISLPILFIRIIYSLLAVVSNKAVFSVMSGSTSAIMTELFMGRIEEMIVVLIYLWAGVTQDAVPDHGDGVQRSKGEKLLYRAERGDFGTGKLGVASFAAHGIVSMLRGNKQGQLARQPVEEISA